MKRPTWKPYQPPPQKPIRLRNCDICHHDYPVAVVSGTTVRTCWDYADRGIEPKPRQRKLW